MKKGLFFVICSVLLVSMGITGMGHAVTLDCPTGYGLSLRPGARFVLSGDTTGRANNGYRYPSCVSWNEYGPEQVFLGYSTAINGQIQASLSNLGGEDLDVFILNSCNSDNCLAFDDNTATASNVPPGAYFFVVDGYGTSFELSERGPFTLTITAECGPAIPLTSGVPYTSETNGGPPSQVDTYSCAPWNESGPEKIHQITLGEPGMIRASLTNLEANLDLFILESCEAGTCLAFGDEAAEYENAPAGTYYIVVDGQNGAAGAYTLTAETITCSDLDCNDNNPCTTDLCQAGVCEHLPVTHGRVCGDDGNECTEDVCNGEGGCVKINKDRDTPCGDPSDTDCTDPNTCSGGGECLSNDLVHGTPCAGDENECTDDICNGNGACIHPNSPAGSACSDDGIECTQDLCNGEGLCQHPNAPEGTPCGNLDDTACTDPDTCNGEGYCFGNHAPAGTPCFDGYFCNGEEACDVAGNCMPGVSPCGPEENCWEESGTCVLKTVLVPDFAGMLHEDALALLREQGLIMGTLETQHSDAIDPGRVMAQDPEQGTSVFWGSPVGFVVSTGPSDCSCPGCVPECEGDFDGDRDVDIADRTVFNGEYGRTNCSSGNPCLADFDLDGDVDDHDLARFDEDFGRTDCRCQAWSFGGPEPQGSAKVMVPVFMYYLERYFLNVPDKTELDLAVAEAVSNSPVEFSGDLDGDGDLDGRDLADLIGQLGSTDCPGHCTGDLDGDGDVGPDDCEAFAANFGGNSTDNFKQTLAYYRAIPQTAKYEFFDPETVLVTMDAGASLDLDFVKSRVGELDPALAWPDEIPAPPDSLLAEDKSTPGDPDISNSEIYRIKLTWQDNSNNEDGFLIYRVFKDAAGLSQDTITQVASVGPDTTTYMDVLSKPAHNNDQYCYRVTAYANAKFALAGQAPAKLESAPSGTACAFYDFGHVQYPPDQDNDGIPDDKDDCKGTKGEMPHGCPDKDLDGIANNKDFCEEVPGYPSGKYVPANRHGCPIRYNIRWMGMDVLGNSYAYDPNLSYKYSFKKESGSELYNEPYKDLFDCEGEEPYLLFSFVNGMDAKGANHKWISRWCCADCTDVKTGDTHEPDGDITGEEVHDTALLLKDLRDNGLTVFPETAKLFAEVDNLGLTMVTTLMERDSTIKISPEKASEWNQAFATGGAVVGAVSTCIGGPGSPGCLLAIGKALKGLVETIFGFMKSDPPPMVVKDPDDHMGSTVWALPHNEADWATSDDGAYGFFFDIPLTNRVSCLGWEPCTPSISVPINLRARVQFCLYREGIAEKDLKVLCPPYKDVRPYVK